MNNFIITDPSLITDHKKYLEKEDEFFDLREKDQVTKMIPFNITSKNNQLEIITVYRLQSTPNDDSGIKDIGETEELMNVERCLLCIAENRKGWNEKYGLTFSTLEEAKEAFPKIIRYY